MLVCNWGFSGVLKIFSILGDRSLCDGFSGDGFYPKFYRKISKSWDTYNKHCLRMEKFEIACNKSCGFEDLDRVASLEAVWSSSALFSFFLLLLLLLFSVPILGIFDGESEPFT